MALFITHYYYNKNDFIAFLRIGDNSNLFLISNLFNHLPKVDPLLDFIDYLVDLIEIDHQLSYSSLPLSKII